MGDGVGGPTGLIVARPVVMEHDHNIGTAIILHHNMEENIVLEILTRISIAINNLVLYMENGQSGQTGQTVVNHVMLDSRHGHDCAGIQISNLLKVSFSVLEMRLTCGPASKGLVLITGHGMDGQAGLNVLSVVDLGSSKDSGTAVEMKT